MVGWYARSSIDSMGARDAFPIPLYIISASALVLAWQEMVLADNAAVGMMETVGGSVRAAAACAGYQTSLTP